MAGQARGELLVLSDPLSLWGGAEVESGLIVDPSHPQRGQRISGKILVMPHGRGSSSSSSVLAEMLRIGTGPAGIIVEEPDGILVVGSLVARSLYGVECPVLVAPFQSQSGEIWEIRGDQLERASGILGVEEVPIPADRIHMAYTEEMGALFSRIPVALYRSSPEGKILAANSTLAHLLGFDSVEELFTGLADVENIYVDPNDRARWVEEMEAHGIVYDFDIELQRPDGTTIWVQDTARAIRDDQGRVLYFEGALIDVTAKVEARREKDEFVATVAHELRNPLAVVLGLGEELANGYDTFTDDDRRELAQLIARQAQEASWLIEDLLVAFRDDVSRVPLSPSAFGPTKEAERVLEVVEKPIELAVEGEEPKVFADPRRTRQILRNLVSNALRYGGEEVVVRISRSDDRAEIKVCDSGDPIPPGKVERIFRPFETAGGKEHPKSVGLGLPAARKLARLMEGDLIYRHLGGYSCFILSLPAA
ncbi:MAG: aconitase X swivel domain-containing protein [Acidimicrobiia bacterium]